MTETEFLECTDALMREVEEKLDALDIDVDTERSGNVLTVEIDDEQIVINRHGPTQQMWLASRHGGRHYAWVSGQWIDTRSGVTFWQGLQEAVQSITHEALVLA